MKRIFAFAVFAAGVAAAGCESPEAARTRGGGPGGDPGNRPAEVMMHEGSRQYWETPVRIPLDPMSLEPANQARQLSLPGAQPRRQSSASSAEASPPGTGRDQ
jgi:hypothetical protein